MTTVLTRVGLDLFNTSSLHALAHGDSLTIRAQTAYPVMSGAKTIARNADASGPIAASRATVIISTPCHTRLTSPLACLTMPRTERPRLTRIVDFSASRGAWSVVIDRVGDASSSATLCRRD